MLLSNHFVLWERCEVPSLISQIKMKYLHLFLSIIYHMKGSVGYYSTVECPSFPQTDILHYHGYDFSPLDCILLTSCSDSFKISNNAAVEQSRCSGASFYNDDFLFDCYPDNGHMCTMKPKVTMIRNWNFGLMESNLCSSSQDSSESSLLPIASNCSLFYKCNWGSAVLFECPPDLHFNAQFGVCDWPWQAGCDSSWSGCPRPYPRCPPDYPRALYLPHPHLCDKFYQCDWGTSHLQTCPTGLHFNAVKKICDWPYKANCQVC